MPYYRSYHVNRSELETQIGAAQVRPIALESVELMSFRSREPLDALRSVEVSDLDADPYAYFLSSTTRRRYTEQLKARGLPADARPDRGHAFSLKKHTVKGDLRTFSRTDTVGGVTTASPFRNVVVYNIPSGQRALSHIHQGSILHPAPYKETGLDAFAQTAYSRTAPKAAIFNAGTFLGELLEGLPHITVKAAESVADVFRSVGAGYLNVEFGWKPFLSSLQDVGRALAHTTDMLSHMGKRVHRKMELPPLTFSDSVSYSDTPIAQAGFWGFVPTDLDGTGSVWASDGFSQSGIPYAANWDHLKTRTVTRWFEGEFTSYLPLGFDKGDYAKRLGALLDFRITPETLWELAPWSWLVDWQFRLSDSIKAAQMSADDLLIMHYGYAMEDAIYETVLSWSNLQLPTTGRYRYPGLPKSGTISATTTYRTRLRANPYGFRIGGLSSLTGGQQSILGALGLTKLK